jgi:hypothetical protein
MDPAALLAMTIGQATTTLLGRDWVGDVRCGEWRMLSTRGGYRLDHCRRGFVMESRSACETVRALMAKVAQDVIGGRGVAP